MATEPIALDAALARVDQPWDPRIVARVNDYDVRIVKMHGEFTWHSHSETDEFFQVLDGELRIGLRDVRGEREVVLAKGSIFVVPKGIQHRPFSVHGASVLLFEPTGTVNVGDEHEEIPEHIDATVGRTLD